MTKKHFGGLALGLMLALVVALPAEAATRAEIEAQIAMLRAQLAALTGGSTVVTGQFNVNLTLGSTGGDVTRLQNWLIGKGFAIPAGATGYFGAQTQTALARYQASVGIAPAAGYFGPVTRAKVNGTVVVTPTPTPTPTPDDDDDEDRANAQDARDVISDLEDAIEDADEDINNNNDDANDLLDEARDKVDEAEDAFDDRDYDEAIDIAEEGMDLVDEALDEAGLGNNDDADEDDAEDAIDDLDAAIADAQDDIDDAEDDGEDVDDANDLLDEARDLLADAEDALDDEDYDEVMDLTDEGMDLVEEALDEANVDTDNEGDARTVSTSAKTTSVDGADNDLATFEIKLALTAFGGDMYIPRDGNDAFTYRIENASNGDTVTGGSASETVSSTADMDGDYYVIQDDDEETFTFRVVFNPDAADEGNSLRLQLLTVRYSDDAQAPTASWSTQGDNEFETKSTFVAD